jgi:phosphonate transport system substrate-binding protein
MGQYLTRELGLPVQMMALENYLAVIHGLKNRGLEGALLGANAYIEAADLKLVEPAAMELYYSGHRGYQSILIARRGSNFHRLEDARGKVLAFSDPDSTSGFLVPMLHFIQDLGVAPAGFASQVVFTGSHGAVVKGVNEGRYALGATNDVDLARAVAELHLQKTDFRILWTSQMIPGALYCIRKDLPDSLKTSFRQALVNLKDQAILANLKIVGLSPAADSDYNLIRDLRKLNQPH